MNPISSPLTTSLEPYTPCLAAPQPKTDTGPKSMPPHQATVPAITLSLRKEPTTNILPPYLGSDDLSLPKATVQKIVSEILPPSAGVSFAKEARDVLIECCVEFITLVSSEANEISEKEAKKTIACDHITKALEQLGFSDYVPAVLEAAQEHKEVQKVGSHSVLCLFW